MESSKKDDIIIELGFEFIRAGLVGDKGPRKTLRTNLFKNPSVFSSAQFEI